MREGHCAQLLEEMAPSWDQSERVTDTREPERGCAGGWRTDSTIRNGDSALTAGVPALTLRAPCFGLRGLLLFGSQALAAGPPPLPCVREGPAQMQNSGRYCDIPPLPGTLWTDGGSSTEP